MQDIETATLLSKEVEQVPKIYVQIQFYDIMLYLSSACSGGVALQEKKITAALL